MIIKAPVGFFSLLYVSLGLFKDLVSLAFRIFGYQIKSFFRFRIRLYTSLKTHGVSKKIKSNQNW